MVTVGTVQVELQKCKNVQLNPYRAFNYELRVDIYNKFIVKNTKIHSYLYYELKLILLQRLVRLTTTNSRSNKSL